MRENSYLLQVLFRNSPYTPTPLHPYTQHEVLAQGSLKELETHLLLSIRVELASSQTINPVLNQCESVGRLLLLLIRALENKKSS